MKISNSFRLDSIHKSHGRTTYGELSGGSSSTDFASSPSRSKLSSSSLEIYGDEAGVSCPTGLPGTANPVAKEYLESAPIPTSDAAEEGRRFRPSRLYRPLLLRRPDECDLRIFDWRSSLGPLGQLSELVRESWAPLRLSDGLDVLASSESSCGVRTAPYDDEPSAGDVRMRGVRDMKDPMRWARDGEGEGGFTESGESPRPSLSSALKSSWSQSQLPMG